MTSLRITHSREPCWWIVYGDNINRVSRNNCRSGFWNVRWRFWWNHRLCSKVSSSGRTTCWWDVHLEILHAQALVDHLPLLVVLEEMLVGTRLLRQNLAVLQLLGEMMRKAPWNTSPNSTELVSIAEEWIGISLFSCKESEKAQPQCEGLLSQLACEDPLKNAGWTDEEHHGAPSVDDGTSHKRCCCGNAHICARVHTPEFKRKDCRVRIARMCASRAVSSNESRLRIVSNCPFFWGEKTISTSRKRGEQTLVARMPKN